MSAKGQKITKRVYEDAEIVKGYIKAHAENPKLFELLDKFASKINGGKIIDIGCGPGHDSYRFSELGFDVVGVDYSSEMIKSAKAFKHTKDKPKFMVGDMRDLAKMFKEDSFNAAWVSASMLHIPEKDVPQVLAGIKKIVKDEGKV